MCHGSMITYGLSCWPAGGHGLGFAFGSNLKKMFNWSRLSGWLGLSRYRLSGRPSLIWYRLSGRPNLIRYRLSGRPRLIWYRLSGWPRLIWYRLSGWPNLIWYWLSGRPSLSGTGKSCQCETGQHDIYHITHWVPNVYTSVDAPHHIPCASKCVGIVLNDCYEIGHTPSYTRSGNHPTIPGNWTSTTELLLSNHCWTSRRTDSLC